MASPPLTKYLGDLIFPLPLLAVSLFYFIVTFLTNPLLPLRDIGSFKEKAFAKLWLNCGSLCAADTPAPLPPLLAASKGLVLDVGPGSGEQVHRFTHPEGITAVYGVEPGVSMHEQLRRAATRAGLGPKYHVLGCTADLDAMVPQLIKAGVLHPERTAAQDLAVFDEIVCLRVLCGVPDQRATVADLYSLLKPGGRFVVCEHVLNQRHRPAQLAQRIYMLLGWRHLMGGCDLVRDTLNTFLQVAKERDGGFARVDMGSVDDYSPTTHIVGVLTKKKK